MAHIQKGGIDNRSAVYNGYADAAADAGHHGTNIGAINEVLDFLAQRQHQSYKLHLAIARRIARVATEVLSRLDKQCEKGVEDSRYIAAPPMPTWPQPHEGIWLHFGALPGLPSDEEQRLQHQMVRTFWQRLRIVPDVSGGRHGTTWLELFLLFSLMGGLASSPMKQHLRQSHDRRFKAFRKSSKQLFRFASADIRPPVRLPLIGPATGMRLPVCGPLGVMGSGPGSPPSVLPWL